MFRLKRISLLAFLILVVLVLRGCGDEQTGATCQADSCSGHGACVDTGGTITCECFEGYAGDICDSCAASYQDYGDGECRPSDPCADDTACAAQNRVCTNDQGSAVCGDCLAGYHDEAGTCVADESCLATSCSGHGTCDDAGGVINCTCDANYTGDHCEACESGYVFFPPDSGTCEDDACDPDPCNIPNTVADGCVQTDVDVFECTCETGYAWDGSACVTDCQDEDDDGYGTGSACAGTDCDDNDADIFEGNPDVCDNKDNDCDPATADGSADPLNGAACDGSDSDLCEEGTYSCSGGALVCSDNTGDDLDVCDGADNDCDPASADGDEDPQAGQACDGADSDLCEDDTLACSGGSMQCSNTSGNDLDVCDGADNDCDPASADGSEDPLVGAACDGPDSDLCEEGTNSCTGGSLVCSDNTGDDLDICDGADNDCDPASADGSEDPLVGAACDGPDSDLCEEGTNTCSGGSLVCSDNTGDTLDICDGADNDCDPASADGSEDPQAGQACDGADSDLCAEGTSTCSGGVLECSDNTTSTTDVCDGVDNDCDPASPDGSEDPQIGDPCDGPDSDLCMEGTRSCSGGTLVCSDNTSDTLDICDGANNDCDPASADGSDDPMIGTLCDGSDSDLCNEGTYSCSGGSLVCSDTTGSTTDVCDGVDNDCDPASPDGSEDPQIGDPCDGPDSDLCNEGTYSCSGGSLVCSDTSGNTLDICDGINNDCNAATPDGIDEPNLGDPCDGPDSDLCNEGNLFCNGASGMACSDTSGDIPELCDGINNDCNAATPDGYDEPTLGDPCDGGDSDSCEEGTFFCNGASGMACSDTTPDSLETCNGVDDDCDAETDEDFDKTSDPLNCGTCGNVCGTGIGGLCCSSTCILPDANNCGTCGVSCSAGLLVINELIINPSMVGDAEGEWFEIYNPNNFDIDLRGFVLRDFDSDSHTIDSPTPVIAPAMGYVVLGSNANPSTNGGVSVAYQYPHSDLALGNLGDELAIYSPFPELLMIDELWWGGTFDTDGKSKELSTNHDNATDNNILSNWCDAVTPYGDGDLGTPGSTNDCTLPP